MLPYSICLQQADFLAPQHTVSRLQQGAPDEDNFEKLELVQTSHASQNDISSHSCSYRHTVKVTAPFSFEPQSPYSHQSKQSTRCRLPSTCLWSMPQLEQARLLSVGNCVSTELRDRPQRSGKVFQKGSNARTGSKDNGASQDGYTLMLLSIVLGVVRTTIESVAVQVLASNEMTPLLLARKNRSLEGPKQSLHLIGCQHRRACSQRKGRTIMTADNLPNCR